MPPFKSKPRFKELRFASLYEYLSNHNQPKRKNLLLSSSIFPSSFLNGVNINESLSILICLMFFALLYNSDKATLELVELFCIVFFSRE